MKREYPLSEEMIEKRKTHLQNLNPVFRQTSNEVKVADRDIKKAKEHYRQIELE